ncbi:hypothetical protein DFQ14_103223 [Halopolyspora algeriensis]|uniref:DUF2332 domain-containing protein n=1 Tax=Halopolyspora algeriensis TaxID=1500506 RepID=A0A368VVD7_9ACTN|nr:DUF2332 domain-containing protein [Halopolyspora algeriensis]RCW45256.1 hypothetical protein DFQ14_103223 [Halopolyspora algeriensis]TQM53025.1 hypothetical protein FHU43_2401 [Halopolyspora algeriensis]
MTTANEIAERYRAFAGQEASPSSPHYAALANAVADDPELCGRIAALPARCHQPALFLAAVRFATGSIPVDGPDLLGRASTAWEAVSGTMRARSTQTNEPGRCAALLPALQDLPQPLALIEVGASAGLCLLLDRYRYEYRGVRTASLGAGDCRLDCELRPGAPIPRWIPDIAWRAGLDRNPLDVTDERDMRWLRCLVWPDMPARAERLERARSLAEADPPHVRSGDLVGDLPALLAEAPAAATPVVVHSAVLAYVDAERARAFVATVRDAGAVRIGLEAPMASPASDGPGGTASAGFRWGSALVLDRDGERLASCAHHGGWLGPPHE